MIKTEQFTQNMNQIKINKIRLNQFLLQLKCFLNIKSKTVIDLQYK